MMIFTMELSLIRCTLVSNLYCSYLGLKDDFSDGRLYDIGPVQAVNTVHPEHSHLVADHALTVDPDGRG